MNIYLEIFIRALVSCLALLIIARIIGVRQISQLTFFDYVTGITIGSIAGTMAIDPDIPLGYSLLALAVFGVISIVISLLTSKSIIMRRMLTGTSKFLIYKGNFVEHNMKMARFDVNDILRELRSQGYFNVAEVEYAMLESNGKISVLPKSTSRPANSQEVGLDLPVAGITADVIIDGKIMEENLAQQNVDKNWIMSELKKQGIDNVKDILLANLNDNMELSVYFKGQTDEDMSTVYE